MVIGSIIAALVVGLIGYWVTGLHIDEMGDAARKKKWIGFFISTTVGFVLFYFAIFPWISTRIAQDALSYQRQRVEAYYLTDPVLMQMAETDPTLLAQIRDAVDKAILQGKRDKDVDAVLFEQTMQIGQKYLTSSDEDLVQSTVLTIRVLRPVKINKPQVCTDALMYPLELATYLNSVAARDKRTRDEMNTLVVNAIRANRPPKPVDIKMAHKDLDAITGGLTTVGQLEVLSYLKSPDTRQPADDRMCSFFFPFYNSILQLSPDHAANLLRFLANPDGAEPPPVDCTTPACI